MLACKLGVKSSVSAFMVNHQLFSAGVLTKGYPPYDTAVRKFGMEVSVPIISQSTQCMFSWSYRHRGNYGCLCSVALGVPGG
jgi:hypothetical protein